MCLLARLLYICVPSACRSGDCAPGSPAAFLRGSVGEKKRACWSFWLLSAWVLEIGCWSIWLRHRRSERRGLKTLPYNNPLDLAVLSYPPNRVTPYSRFPNRALNRAMPYSRFPNRAPNRVTPYSRQKKSLTSCLEALRIEPLDMAQSHAMSQTPGLRHPRSYPRRERLNQLPQRCLHGCVHHFHAPKSYSGSCAAPLPTISATTSSIKPTIVFCM